MLEKFSEDVLKIEQLLRKINILLKKRLIYLVKDFAITPSQFRLLIILKKRGKSNMKELVKNLHRKPSTVTGIVDRLVNKGFVERSASTEDRRLVRVVLTESGEELVSKIRDQALLLLKGDLQNFTEKERKDFVLLLEKYCRQIEDN